MILARQLEFSLRREKPKCRRPACRRRFAAQTSEDYYCSRDCEERHTQEKITPLRNRQAQEPELGPKIIEPLPAPICCGEELSYGSDPLTGRSLTFCNKCGERPLPNHGTRTYDQGEKLTEALTKKVTVAQLPIQQRPTPPEHKKAA